MNTQEFAEQIDWNQLEDDAIESSKSNQKSIFMVMKAGIHKARIIPKGNELQKLPYITIKHHTLESINTEGKRIPQFVLCWNYIWADLLKQKTNEDRQNKTMLGYLIKNQLMNKDVDFPKYNNFKCPICKAFDHFELLGVQKELKNRFYPKESALFNVLWRKTETAGDDDIHVLSLSKTHFNNIVTFATTCKKEHNISIFDEATGFDLNIQAVGEGMLRRYTLGFLPVSSPSKLEDKVPFNLVQVAANSYKPYQGTINLLKQSANRLIQETGLSFDGDEGSFNNIEERTINLAPESMNVPPPPMTIPQIPSVQSGTTFKNNVLYDSSGKELF